MITFQFENFLSAMNKIKYILFGLIVILSLAPSINTYLNLHHSQQYTMDFGVYHNAIIEIGTKKNWNPYIGFRDVKIFSDHVDPIIIPFALLSPFFDYSYAWSLSIEVLFYLFFLALIFGQIKNLSLIDFSLLLLLVTFNRGIVSAIGYQIHPSTWSLVPMLYVLWAIRKNDIKHILISTIILNTFKEIFPFCGFFLGLSYFIFQKERKWGGVLMIIHLAFLLFNFKYRSYFFGPSYSHFPDIFTAYQHFNVKDFLKICYPSVFLLFYCTKGLLRDKKVSELCHILSIYLPLLGIHILAGKSYYHYGVFIGAPILIYFVILKDRYIKEMPLKAKYMTLVLILLAGMGRFTKPLKAIKNHIASWDQKEKNRDNLKDLQKLIIQESDNNSYPHIMGTPGLITTLMKPGAYYYQYGDYSKIQEHFDYLIFGKTRNSNIYPLTVEQSLKIIDQCRPFVQELLFENDDYFFAKGPFPKSCYLQYGHHWRNFKIN